MLENLNKTVIVTGSQIPISRIRNDGFDNLLGSLTIATHYVIPEVTLFFDKVLLRGNRASKVDASGLHAFDSEKMQPLVRMAIDIDVQWSLVRRPPPPSK
jgi:60kDa lysophospholipase